MGQGEGDILILGEGVFLIVTSVPIVGEGVVLAVVMGSHSVLSAKKDQELQGDRLALTLVSHQLGGRGTAALPGLSPLA